MGLLVAAFAEGTTGYLSADTLAAFTDAFQSISVDVNSMIKVALPIGLGIMGLFLAVRLGIRFFRSIAS
ncbi:MAG: hypothetical protein HDT21_01410 [Ruminococcus sp.]|nr:hypothetical protein [Ruminococcus sp.]